MRFYVDISQWTWTKSVTTSDTKIKLFVCPMKPFETTDYMTDVMLHKF